VSYVDQGCHNGILYFVMEYCGDGSVNDLMAKSGGRLPVKTAVGLILQALDGLAYAHKLNFVHRDLKPSNILLGRLGTVTIFLGTVTIFLQVFGKENGDCPMP